MLSLWLCSFLALMQQAKAQSTTSALSSAGDSVQLFIDNMDPIAGWAASVQNACNGSTTYAVSCTSAPNNNACSPQTLTVTEGADFYIVTTPAIYSETSATITESCSLNTASSSASCVATIVAGNYGNNIFQTTSYNLTGSNYYQYDVQITAGAKKTEDGGVCSEGTTNAPITGGPQDVLFLSLGLAVGCFGVFVL